MFCESSAGHVPGRPQGGRHGMVFGQIPVSIPGSVTSATTTAAPLGTASSSAPVAPLVPGRVTSAPILFHERMLFSGECSVKVLFYYFCTFNCN